MIKISILLRFIKFECACIRMSYVSGYFCQFIYLDLEYLYKHELISYCSELLARYTLTLFSSVCWCCVYCVIVLLLPLTHFIRVRPCIQLSQHVKKSATIQIILFTLMIYIYQIYYLVSVWVINVCRIFDRNKIIIRTENWWMLHR